MLAISSSAVIVNSIPLPRSCVWPYNRMTIRTMRTLKTAWMQSAAAAAIHPSRLTGMCVPSSSRYTMTMTAVQQALEARLNASLMGGGFRGLRTSASSPQATQRTRSPGDRNANPSSTGTSPSMMK